MGSTYARDFRYFDNLANLMYISVYHVKNSRRKGLSIEQSRLNNVGVYDMAKDETTYLFGELSEKQYISGIWFETHFDKKNAQMGFNDFHRVSNNERIERRKVKDRLLISIRDAELKSMILWSFTKKGENPEKIVQFDQEADWFIDVFNNKIRIIEQKLDKLEITNFDW